MSEKNIWCPTKSCWPGKAEDQLCDVCRAVLAEVRNAVYETSAKAQRKINSILQEIRDQVFGGIVHK